MDDSKDQLALLARIDQRLERLERLADRVERLEGHALAATAVFTDTADRALGQAAQRGFDLEARARATASLVERLSDPEVSARLEAGLLLLQSAPAALAMATDTLDSLVARLVAAGIDPDARARNLANAAERLTSDEAIEVLHSVLDRLTAVRTLLDSGILDPASTEVVGRMARAMAHAAAEPAGRIGPWGAFQALRDPDVSHTLDFLVRFARGFGRVASTSQALAATTQRTES